MSLIPPLDVAVSARRQSCILDVPLALSRCGLLFAVRVAREMNVWLARTLWQILDSAEFYRTDSRMRVAWQGCEVLDAQGGSGLPLIIGEWEQARLESDLLGLNVFWAGDARHESLLPKDIDKNLVNRLDQATAELELGWAGNDGDYDLLRECHRDAVALAMALMPYGPLILTLRTATGPNREPAICRYLQECGIPTTCVSDARATREVRANLNHIFARTGIAELTWAGLDLAALHLVAPHALMLGAFVSNDQDFTNESDMRNAMRPAHEAASAWWWPLS